MKKLFLFLTLTATLLSFSLDADAQYRGKKKKKKKKTSKEKIGQKSNSEEGYHKVWYGLDLIPGIGEQNIGGNFSGTSVSMSFGPMAGFRLSEHFSVGPRFQFVYIGGNYFNGASDNIVLDTWDISVSGFARYDFLKYFFAHAEVERLSESFATGVIDNDNRLEITKESSVNIYLGLGVGTGGKRLSFNGSLLYDVGERFEFNGLFGGPPTIPLVLRLGLRYHYF